MTDLTALAQRAALPEEFQALVREFPRDGWTGAIGPFTSFYLERHEFFRRVSEKLIGEVEAFLDAEREVRQFGGAVSRFGSIFVTELHGHHMIEDHHYFPKISGLDPRVERAFDLLDADHHAMDESLTRFQTLGNSALQDLNTERRFQSADRLLTGLNDTRKLLLRHLEDEEDIVVPLMLKFGEADVLD